MQGNKKGISPLLLIGVFTVITILLLFTLVIPSFLPALASGLSGRAAALASILVSLLVILAVPVNLSRLSNGRRVHASPYLIPLLLFMISGLLINLPKPDADYNRWGFIVISTPMLYITVTNLLRSQALAELSLAGVVLAGTMVTVLMTFSDAAGNFPSFQGIVRHRGAAYFLGQTLGPVALANIAGVTFLPALVLFLYSSTGWIKPWMLPSIAFTLVAVAVSGGRMALLALIAAVLIMIRVRKPSALRSRWRTLVFMAGILTAVAAVYFLSSEYNQVILSRLLKIPSSLINYREDRAISARIELWQLVWEMIRNHPFGLGFDAFFNEYGLSTHNEYFNLVLGSGVQGLLAVITFGLLCFRQCYRAAVRKRRYYAVPLTAVVLLVFTALISLTGAWSYSNTIAALIIWGGLSLGVSGSVSPEPAETAGAIGDHT